MKAICILYGIGEGDYHGRAFVRELERNGYEVIRDASKADIVVTHSGGCFFLPKPRREQKFILINPPYWPHKPLVLSMFQKVWLDFVDFAKDGKIPQWLIKTVINIAHIIRYLTKSVTISYQAQRRRFYLALGDRESIIIRSDRDTFLAPHAGTLLDQKVHRKIPIHTVPGQHDTCWRDPQPYIEIIRRYSDEQI